MAIYDEDGEHDSEEDSWSEASGKEEGRAESRSEGSEGEEVQAAAERDTYKPVTGEDIYGRALGAASAVPSATKYVPPALRAKQAASEAGAARKLAAPESAERQELLGRLSRKITGSLNRLAESSLEHTAKELLPLFAASGGYAGADTTEAVTEGIIRICVSETQVLKSLVPAAAALIVALNVLLRNGTKGSCASGARVPHFRCVGLCGRPFIGWRLRRSHPPGRAWAGL